MLKTPIHRLQHPHLRSAIYALLIAVGMGAWFWVQMTLTGTEENRRAAYYEKRQQLDQAITHYRRAARAYAPLNPAVERALERLKVIGLQEARRSHLERALSAQRSIRAAINATRSFYVPHRKRLLEADQQIAVLMARLPPAPIDENKTFDERRSLFLKQLRKFREPHLAAAFCAVLGLCVWVIAAYRFFSLGLDVEGRVVRAPAVKWSLVFVGGLACFIIGLSTA